MLLHLKTLRHSLLPLYLPLEIGKSRVWPPFAVTLVFKQTQFLLSGADVLFLDFLLSGADVMPSN